MLSVLLALGVSLVLAPYVFGGCIDFLSDFEYPEWLDKLIGYTIALGLTIIITTLWIYLWRWAL